MTVLIALIEKTVNTCIHREYKVVGDNVKPGIIRKIQRNINNEERETGILK